ncbi:MAG: phospho-N-acetylmuramoyl-pentapeptide-transferase [Candidatus Saganbacteria bacterium]|nr:phospho-N-acetylmuramoyl-pentapeptide-transferase [Candidatus Saganbacteria bacterium]
MSSLIFIFFAAAIVSLALTFPLLGGLKLFRLGQPVRAEGPPAHGAKAGTPTMGGLGFLLTIVVFTLILIDVELQPAYLALLLLLAAFAAIGLADDLLKIFRRRSLGLTFWEKIVLQVLAAGFFAAYLTFLGYNLSLDGPLAWLRFGNPYLYQLLVIFFVVGFANAANLTDGLNGLLAGTAGLAFLFLGALAFFFLHISNAAAFSLTAAGAVLAFLCYNFPRAALFMGDAGSLPLGAALAGLACLVHQELRLVVIGGVFVIEALSVIIQVTAYKFFKRRVFKMTPLHHTFELMGVKEQWVVAGFWAAGIVFGIVGLWI